MATDPADMVRLLIADTNPDQPILNDQQIQAFLDLNDQSVRRAAADALDSIASSEVLVSKKITTQDLATDGPAVAAELRARAQQLRAQADVDDENSWGGFDVVDTTGQACRPERTGRVIEWDGVPPQVWGL